MGYNIQTQDSYNPGNQVPPETQASATTSMVLEIVFGFFTLMGVGHVYTGRVGLGILLMIGWWIFIGVSGFISTLTLGIGACLFIPLYIALPIISGVQASSYMKRKGGTGSWGAVFGVAGGGCLLVLIFIGALIALGVVGGVVASIMNY